MVLCSDLVRGLARHAHCTILLATRRLLLHDHGAVIRRADCDIASKRLVKRRHLHCARFARHYRERIDPQGRSEISEMGKEMSDDGAIQFRLAQALALRRGLLRALACSAPAFAASCEDLANLKLPDTTIGRRRRFRPATTRHRTRVTRKEMPAFCRVTASVKDAPDSDIRVEMWLPKDQMEGRLPQQRQRRLRRHIRPRLSGMETAVKRGYASATTDMGTAPSNPAQRRSADRPSAEVEGLGKPVDPRDDGRRQGHRQGLLWRRAETFLLHGLLDRRPAGAHRSGVLPRRL